MPDKPSFADGYRSEQVDLVRATCLYVATKLGDLMDDLVVVGGLAPSLLIDQQGLDRGADLHVGTMDLDVGLAVALLNQGRYRTITEKLRRAGFAQDVNAEGHPMRTRRLRRPQGSGLRFPRREQGRLRTVLRRAELRVRDRVHCRVPATTSRRPGGVGCDRHPAAGLPGSQRSRPAARC